jgi:uncharacterized SAM-dependent methyltransferase
MKVSPEIPQWLLDIFNKIDYKKVPKMQRYVLIGVIRQWCKKNLKELDKNKTYSTLEVKKIANDFDKELLEILNQFEFSTVSKDIEQQVKIILNSALKSLPLKEKI